MANSSLNQKEKKNARKEKLEMEEQELFQKVRGTIKVYRRLPGQKVIAVKDKKPIVTASVESAVADFSSK